MKEYRGYGGRDPLHPVTSDSGWFHVPATLFAERKPPVLVG